MPIHKSRPVRRQNMGKQWWKTDLWGSRNLGVVIWITRITIDLRKNQHIEGKGKNDVNLMWQSEMKHLSFCFSHAHTQTHTCMCLQYSRGCYLYPDDMFHKTWSSSLHSCSSAAWLFLHPWAIPQRSSLIEKTFPELEISHIKWFLLKFRITLLIDGNTSLLLR